MLRVEVGTLLLQPTTGDEGFIEGLHLLHQNTSPGIWHSSRSSHGCGRASKLGIQQLAEVVQRQGVSIVHPSTEVLHAWEEAEGIEGKFQFVKVQHAIAVCVAAMEHHSWIRQRLPEVRPSFPGSLRRTLNGNIAGVEGTLWQFQVVLHQIKKFLLCCTTFSLITELSHYEVSLGFHGAPKLLRPVGKIAFQQGALILSDVPRNRQSQLVARGWWAAANRRPGRRCARACCPGRTSPRCQPFAFCSRELQAAARARKLRGLSSLAIRRRHYPGQGWPGMGSGLNHFSVWRANTRHLELQLLFLLHQLCNHGLLIGISTAREVI
mmetsp:Transcript_70609/g.155751  ORF Transcript_70609/g.155751 Transcript_70609/m.155751 type:complete len:323 (-) Transcript_70609:153-1121(-)